MNKPKQVTILEFSNGTFAVDVYDDYFYRKGRKIFSSRIEAEKFKAKALETELRQLLINGSIKRTNF